jgi:hypothetical protein
MLLESQDIIQASSLRLKPSAKWTNSTALSRTLSTKTPREIHDYHRIHVHYSGTRVRQVDKGKTSSHELGFEAQYLRWPGRRSHIVGRLAVEFKRKAGITFNKGGVACTSQ